MCRVTSQWFDNINTISLTPKDLQIRETTYKCFLFIMRNSISRMLFILNSHLSILLRSEKFLLSLQIKGIYGTLQIVYLRNSQQNIEISLFYWIIHNKKPFESFPQQCRKLSNVFETFSQMCRKLSNVFETISQMCRKLFNTLETV